MLLNPSLFAIPIPSVQGEGGGAWLGVNMEKEENRVERVGKLLILIS